MCQRKVIGLENLALERISRDIIRHSVKHGSDKDNLLYLIFLRDYSDEVLEAIRKIRGVPEFQKESAGQHVSVYESIFLEENNRNFQRCLNFIFNKFQRRVDLCRTEFNEEVSSAVSRNCKDLRSLALRNVSFVPETRIPLFKSIGNLTNLVLIHCGDLSTETMEAISTSLIHLKVLDLHNTRLAKDALYILCGHKLPLPDVSTSGCCFTKRCEVTSSLQLLHLNISGSEPEISEVACVLTHIPTLKKFHPVIGCTADSVHVSVMYRLTELICDIIESRAASGLLNPTFEIQELDTLSHDIGNWGTFFQCCSKLKQLDVVLRRVQTEAVRNMVEALANTKLRCLKLFEILFPETSNISTDIFKSFWKTIGSQLRGLALRQTSESVLGFSFKDFRNIIMLCPNLENLIVHAVFFRDTEISGHLPDLPILRKLILFLHGDGNVAHTFLYELISSARNLVELHVTSPPATDVELSSRLAKMLTTEFFPNLKVKYFQY